ENLLYDRLQIARLLWPAFRIAGLPLLEAAVYRGTTVTYRVGPPLATARRGSICARRDGLGLSAMMIGWLAGAVRSVLTSRGLRRRFAAHSGYLLPALSSAFPRPTVFLPARCRPISSKVRLDAACRASRPEKACHRRTATSTYPGS